MIHLVDNTGIQTRELLDEQIGMFLKVLLILFSTQIVRIYGCWATLKNRL